MLINYRDMVAKNSITKGQERVLQFFYLHHPKKWTSEEVFREMKKTFPQITLNSVAPRISELKNEKRVLEKVGEKVFQVPNVYT